ncbi:MAG: hypothetical protein Q4A17_06390 [Thermoguttaceae bacterium]|nr:hypothetical protein [Thermoguttaceae bacterium]
MKRFFTALCVFCLTAGFASAQEPELIDRPLTWSIDSIQIVWNVEESQTESYEWRSKAVNERTAGTGKTTKNANSQLSRESDSDHWNGSVESKLHTGIGFGESFLASFGLSSTYSMNAGLGFKNENLDETSNTKEWVKTEQNNSLRTTSATEVAAGVTTKFNRQLIFTVNFVNRSEETLKFSRESSNTIPIYCNNEHLGDAIPVNPSFRIPATGRKYPCQFVLPLDNSGKTALLNSAPDIRILDSQIQITGKNTGEEYDDAFTQSFQSIPHFTVYLIADQASRKWEFKCYKKSKYTLLEALEVLNDEFEEDDFLEFKDGVLFSVAGIPIKPKKKASAFVLFGWNGKPVTDLTKIKPRKDRVFDIILVSREFLEARHSQPLTTLIPFRETLETWAKDGLFDGKYLGWNLLEDENQRFTEIKKLAEAGDAEMQFELSRCYSRGTGVEENEAESNKWLLKSAENDFPKACAKLGFHSFLDQNYSDAKKWLLKAIELGAPVVALLGAVYENEDNYTEAVKWYQKGVDKDDEAAQCELGRCYLLGIGVEKNTAKGLDLLKKSASQEYKHAYALLGLTYEMGRDIEKDLKKAIEYYELASKEPNPDLTGKQGLARCYYIEKDYQKSLDLFLEIPEESLAPYSLRLLALCYEFGFGTEIDFSKSKDYLLKAAQGDDAPAMYLLGLKYIGGKGVPKSYNEGIAWIRKAADKGEELAKKFLQDNPSSNSYQSTYSSGGSQSGGSSGDIDYFQTGMNYFTGNGVTQNYNSAIYYFRQAHDNGHPAASLYLGICYELLKNNTDAILWYRVAARKGNEKAKERLRQMGVSY